MFSCFSYLVVLKPESQQGWISNTTKCLIVKKVFLSRVSFLINNHKQSFNVIFKKKTKKKTLHRDSLVLILSVWSEPAVSKITAQQSATWMAKTGWLFLFPCFFVLFLLFCLKKNDLVWMINFYPVKLQLGREIDAIVSKVTIKWNICMSVWALL